MRRHRRQRGGFTMAELLVGLALTAMLMLVVAMGIYAATASNEYNTTKVELVATARGVLNRIAADVRRCERAVVNDDGDSLNILLRDDQGATFWRQYRFSVDGDSPQGTIIVFESPDPIPLPPTEIDDLPSATLAEHVTTFEVSGIDFSEMSITEQLSARITVQGTGTDMDGNQVALPLDETTTPYVLKLSPNQYDELADDGYLSEGVDLTDPPEYDPDEDESENEFWLAVEDSQAPGTYYEPWADWDYEDVLVKVTETDGQVEMEFQYGTAAYDCHILGPDGDVLYEHDGSQSTYTYNSYCTACETVKIELEMDKDEVATGGTITVSRRESLF